jgi:hypothetical protein
MPTVYSLSGPSLSHKHQLSGPRMGLHPLVAHHADLHMAIQVSALQHFVDGDLHRVWAPRFADGHTAHAARLALVAIGHTNPD